MRHFITWNQKDSFIATASIVSDERVQVVSSVEHGKGVGNVRFGSLADISRCGSDVRFTPNSGRNSGHRGSRWRAEHSDLPSTFKRDLLRYGEGIVHINAQIPHSAVYLSVTKQKLDGAQIPGAPIKQCRLRAPLRAAGVLGNNTAITICLIRCGLRSTTCLRGAEILSRSSGTHSAKREEPRKAQQSGSILHTSTVIPSALSKPLQLAPLSTGVASPLSGRAHRN